MQNDDEVPNGQSQDGGMPEGLFARWAPPMLLQDIGTCKLILNTDENESTPAIGPG